MTVVLLAVMVACTVAGAEVFVGPQAPERDLGVVENSSFESGGMSYADRWRPLPGAFRMHRRLHDAGEYSLFLQLLDEGDGGVMQVVELPPNRSLSLRMLATCHTNTECAVVATLTRAADGVVLAEVVVGGIERGVLAQAFDSGTGGPAELMVRVVGESGGRALVDRVTIARPVAAHHARRPDYSGSDLLLASGEGLRVDADFRPSLLPVAARMLQEAIEDLTGAPTTRVAGAVSVSVDEPQATGWPERESYRLSVGEAGVTIAAPAEEGAFRGMMTLLDLIRADPGGGARVVAVDAREAPALPWRIGSDHGLSAAATSANAARKLARMKLNMALAPHDASGGVADGAAVEALREVGIEPVLVVSGDTPGGARPAMEEAVARLDVRYLFVSPPLVEAPVPGAPLAWSEAPLSEIAAFAAEHRDELTIIVPAAARAPMYSSISGVPISLEGWPREIVAAIHPSQDADRALQRASELARSGARSIFYHFDGFDGVSRALSAREEGIECMGALITAEVARGADLSWRGRGAER
jgi:hypothetical protein